MDLQLDGKKAFISGSTRGIGYAVARALAGEGVDVVLSGRNPDRLSEAVGALRREAPGASVTGAAVDFSDPGDVDRLCAELGEFDVLVNNVGVFDVKPFGLVTDADWRHHLEVNVLSGVKLARRLLPGMLERGWGRVVFVSSESGVDVPADMVHYGASKAAVLAVGNGLAKLTRGSAVTVNSVVGGPTWSDGVADAVGAIAAAHSSPVEDVKAAIIGANPTSLLQRFIEPREIADAVTFLASPLASAVNGSAVRVDGGVLTTLL